jgi:hypothetical protein
MFKIQDTKPALNAFWGRESEGSFGRGLVKCRAYQGKDLGRG